MKISRMSSEYFLLLVALVYAAGCSAQVYTNDSGDGPQADQPGGNDNLITQTVYGFLDFTTTIGNTVMIFSPQSVPAEGDKGKKGSSVSVIQTKPVDKPKKDVVNIQPSKTHKPDPPVETKKQQAKGTKVAISSTIQHIGDNPSGKSGQRTAKSQENASTRVQVTTKNPQLSSVVHVQSKDEVPGVKNNLAEPEYDYLSKQPTEIVDETYKVINLRPSSKPHAKPRATVRKEKENPTGLVTKLGGTIVKDGLTTVHETSVIGTYINGKYAQVLQSSSRILANTPPLPEGKIRPTNTLRILKTIGPQLERTKPQLEPTPTNQQEESSLPLEVLFSASAGSTVRTTRRNSANGPNRPKFRKVSEDYDSNETQQTRAPKNRPTTAKPNYKNRAPSTTTSEPSVAPRRTGFRPSSQSSSRLKPNTRAKGEPQSTSPSPILKVKLPRTQGRWSYKTTPKPRIAIRKQIDEDEPRSSTEASTTETILLDESKTTSSSASSATSSSSTSSTSSTTNAQRKIQDLPPNDDELDPSESEDVPSVSVHEQQHPEQILPVETINVEISTGADLNNAYFEIATIKSPYAFQVGTLRNTRYITLTSTIKKTFAAADTSTAISPTEPLTENILVNTGAAYETSLPLDSAIATLPAISLDSAQATPPLETITETFSTTQTLLKTHLLPVIHNGNTTRLTLVQTYNIARTVTATKTLPPMEIYQFIPSKTLNEFNSKLDEAGSELHLELQFSDDDRDDEDAPKRVVAPNADADSDLDPFRSISSSRPKLEPTASVPSEPQLTPEQAQQLALFKYFGQPQPQVPQLPLFPQQPQFTVTSAPLITQTLATVSDSRVLKLTFGAKTAYTTLFSTRVVPTEITTYVTTTVPLQPSVPAYPGYYPPPVGYPPFPYVG